MRALVFGCRILRFCRLEDGKAERMVHVMIILFGSQEIWRRVGVFPVLTAMSEGAWLGFG